MWFVFYCTFLFFILQTAYCVFYIVCFYCNLGLLLNFTWILLYFTNPASWLPHWNKRLSCEKILIFIHTIQCRTRPTESDRIILILLLLKKHYHVGTLQGHFTESISFTNVSLYSIMYGISQEMTPETMFSWVLGGTAAWWELPWQMTAGVPGMGSRKNT